MHKASETEHAAYVEGSKGTEHQHAILTLKLEIKGKSIGWIDIRLHARDLDLSSEEFSKRFLRPAFEQAKSRAEEFEKAYVRR